MHDGSSYVQVGTKRRTYISCMWSISTLHVGPDQLLGGLRGREVGTRSVGAVLPYEHTSLMNFTCTSAKTCSYIRRR